MAQVKVRGPDGGVAVVEARLTVSMLNTLLAAGVPVRHDCGGKALCGTCRVRVLAGSGGLSPVRAREAARLAAVDAMPDERLACQCYASGDVEIATPRTSP